MIQERVLSTLALLVAPWRLPLARLVDRFDEVVAGSLVLVFVTVSCVGATMCDQAAGQAMRLLGDQSFIGPEYIVLGFEEFGPLIVALTLAARVGAGFAAEVAILKGEQTLDALDLYGARPEITRLAPMGVALALGGACLGILAAAVWEIAGIFTMWARHGVNPLTFFHPDAVSVASVLLCLIKNTVMGALVFVGALIAGLGAKGGAEEVGEATTRAVVLALLFVLSANVVIDVLWFLLRGPA